MPTYTTDGDREFVSVITGPSHVRLGLKFTVGRVESPVLVKQSPIGDCHCGQLDEAKIVAAVVSAVAEVNQRLGVAEIVYVADDSPRYSLYARCAKLLALRHADG
ncbi:MAG: hypothetical protein JNL96_03425 [Planctomycetaceae bacterium]|nr:hypothetical protein [Planctomycetaceae bacterium]